MPGFPLTYIFDFLIAFAGASAVYAYWVANRRRIAAETVGRAEEQSRTLLRDAERDADARKKEALLEAKERAHELRVEAEQFARDHRQQVAGMEQILLRRETALAEQQQALDRRGQLVAAREQEIVALERQAAEHFADQKRSAESLRRDLERVAALTRDEAR